MEGYWSDRKASQKLLFWLPFFPWKEGITGIHALDIRRQTQRSVPQELMDEQAPDLLTVQEVAKELRVEDTTVRRWITNGALEAIILPHHGKRHAYRIRRQTLNRLLQPVLLSAASGSDGSAH